MNKLFALSIREQTPKEKKLTAKIMKIIRTRELDEELERDRIISGEWREKFQV